MNRAGLALVVPSLLAAAFACGKKPDPALAPDTMVASSAPSGGASSPPAATETSPAVTAGPPSTTLAVGDGGAGTRLSAAGGDAGASRGPDPGRSAEDIKARVLSQRDDMRACYDDALKDHPGLQGNLVIKFVIDPKGAVKDTSVDTAATQILDDGVQQCVMKIFRRFAFPPHSRGLETRSTYPLNFVPRIAAPKKP